MKSPKCDTVRLIGATLVDREGSPVHRHTCLGCHRTFYAKRRHAKTCGDRCRQILSRLTTNGRA